VLGLLFGQPERTFQSGELIRLVDSGSGATQRVIARFATAGLVSVTRIGNQKHYQANRASPVFHELHGLITKTSGLAEPLRRALEPYRSQIVAAFVFGSVASGTESATSDVDVMVIGDDLAYAQLFEAFVPAERELARTIHPNAMTLSEWRTKLGSPGSFASRVAREARVWLIGSDDALN
jgi:predicted nucleotidyltransferase